MLKLNKKTWLFLLLFIVLQILLGNLYPDNFSKLDKIGLNFFFILVLIGLFVRSHKVVISLKPNNKILNWKYLIIIILVLLIYSIYSSNFLDYKNSSFSIILYTLFVAFIQTLSEELIFRGILLNDFLIKTKNLYKAVFYSAIFFGLIHLFSLTKTSDYVAVFNQVIMAFMAGVFFGALFVYCRNIYIIGFLHFLINIPAYFNRIIHSSNTETIIDESVSVLETIFSSIGIILIYSPLLYIGFFILKRIKKNNSFKIEPIIENSFSIKKNKKHTT